MNQMEGGATGYRVDRESVDSMQLDGEAVVLNLRAHGYYGLNATATEVWELVRAHPGISQRALSDVLGARYGLEGARAAADVGSVIDQMLRHGLIAACEPTAHQIAATHASGPYLAPSLEAYGDLDTLVLSGE